MTAPITFTFDLEDHRLSPGWEPRYPAHARKLLDFLDERKIRATVFVVGRVAERSPDLIREVAERGHEIGLHNYEHWALFSCVPSTFRERTARAKAFLEELTGHEVTGYRSPAGTLTPATFWATEALADVGFVYSASVLPVQTYGVGFPGCPLTPFRWPSGLIEAPCPCLSVGPVGLPMMGGTFLRVLPLALVRAGSRRLPEGAVPWVYAHPYDIDTLEPFWIVPEVHWWGSVLLWLNRGLMLRKVERLLGDDHGDTLGVRLAKLDATGEIPEWAPPPEGLEHEPAERRVTDRVVRVLRRERIRSGMAPPQHLQHADRVDAASAVR